MMNIEEIISAFKKHQLQYGLDGDSGLKELYPDFITFLRHQIAQNENQ